MLHLLGFGWQAYVVVFLIVLVLVYLVLLELRLQCSHPDAVPFTAPPMSEKDLLNTTYNLSDSWTYKLPEPHLDSIHVVVGGSGSLGAAVCRLLMERGHRLRIVDMQPPDPLFSANPLVDFVQANITDEEQVKKAFTFSGKDLDYSELVVYHTAAAIRYYERHSYLRDLSDAVNVKGTKHIIDAIQSSKAFKAKQLVYISSAAACVHQPSFLWLRRPATPIMRDDLKLHPKLLNANHYNRTKREAEVLVREANGPDLKTASLRIGMGVVGPRDLFIGVYLTRPVVPIWGQDLVHHSINVFDAARAMVCCEDKLRNRPADVAGESFLVTGKGLAWTFREYRRATEVMARRKLPYVPVSAAFIFLASHLVEFVFASRFYLLRCIGIKPAPVPNWAKFFGPDLLSLQPSTFDTASSDMIILDRRARERLGYEPIWETAQTIKWCTDVVESTKNFGPIGNWS